MVAETHSYGPARKVVVSVELTSRSLPCPDHVKVLDFGLLKEQRALSAELSVAGTLLGTPAYLPPEAVLDPKSVEARSDLYAVGAVGYFMLSGTLVFDGGTLLEVCAKHLHQQPDPLSHRTSSPVAAALERAILQCLAKKPADRPASATELIRMLEQVPLTESWSQHEAEQWWQAHGERALSTARAGRRNGSSARPLTMGVDLTQRAASS